MGKSAIGVASVIILGGVLLATARAEAGFAGYDDLNVAAGVAVDPVFVPPTVGAGTLAGSGLTITTGGLDSTVSFDPAGSLTLDLSVLGDGIAMRANANASVDAANGDEDAFASLFADGEIRFQNTSANTLFQITLGVDAGTTVRAFGSPNPSAPDFHLGAFAAGLVLFSGPLGLADLTCGGAACAADNLGLGLPTVDGASVIDTITFDLLPLQSLALGARIEADAGAFAEFVAQGAWADTTARFTITGIQAVIIDVPEPDTWAVTVMGLFALGLLARGRRRNMRCL